MRSISRAMQTRLGMAPSITLLLASPLHAPSGGRRYEQKADFDQHLFAIQKIRRPILQLGVDQSAVNKHCRGGKVRHVVELFPRTGSQLRAEVRSYRDSQKSVQRQSPEIVIGALPGRINGRQNIGDSKMRRAGE